MGVFGKFKDLIGIEEITDDDISEEEINAASAKLEKKQESRAPYVSSSSGSSGKASDGGSGIPRAPQLQNRVTINNSTSPFKLVVIEPKGFEECPKLVDSLKGRKPVIINLEQVEKDTARKIFDFLGGATYALNGNVQKVANNIFIFAPENVNIAASVDHKSIDISGIQPKNVWSR